MKAPTIDDTAVLASQMRVCVGRLRRRLAAERNPGSVAMPALAVLCTLDRDGAMSIGELASHEQVQPPSMTRTISALEQQGCVRRCPHPADGRVTIVDITDRGRAVILADRDTRDAWLACQLDGLPRAERELVARAVPILEMLSRCR